MQSLIIVLISATIAYFLVVHPAESVDHDYKSAIYYDIDSRGDSTLMIDIQGPDSGRIMSITTVLKCD